MRPIFPVHMRGLQALVGVIFLVLQEWGKESPAGIVGRWGTISLLKPVFYHVNLPLICIT